MRATASRARRRRTAKGEQPVLMTPGGRVPVGRGRVAVLTPTGADASVTQRVLAGAGFEAQLCADIDNAARTISEEIVALVVAEEALTALARARIFEVLQQQPPWSDVPVIVL